MTEAHGGNPYRARASVLESVPRTEMELLLNGWCTFSTQSASMFPQRFFPLQWPFFGRMLMSFGCGS